MALFPRRVLQRELDRLQPNVINPAQRKDVVARLNGRERQAISAAWEVALAGAFSRHAAVRYEEQIGRRRPDLYVKWDEQLEFVVDVVAISDEDAEKRNPSSYFFEEFRRLCTRHALKGGFDIRIGNQVTGRFPDKQNRLLLPPKNEIALFIRRELTTFVRAIAANPATPRSYQRKDSDLDMTITYNPAQTGYNTGGYSDCTAAYSLKKNPLYGALDAKATKLRQSAYPGLKGIVVVDGGSQLLRNTQRSGGSHWSVREITEKFLQNHRYIDFVTTTHHEEAPRIFGDSRQWFKNTIFWQRPFNQQTIDSLYSLINKALKSLPVPMDSPHNAYRVIHSRRTIERGCKFGWYDWTPMRRLAFSSRTLLPLLAGTMRNAEFKLLLNHFSRYRHPLLDFFANVFRTGQRIEDIYVEQLADEDDDFVVFDLSAPRVCRPAPKTAEELVCEIPTSKLVEYFARLASEALGGEERFSIGVLPIPVQERIRECMRAYRLPIFACLSSQRDTIRLHFGAPDPATAPFH